MNKILKLIIPILLFMFIFSNNSVKNYNITKNNYKGQRVLNACDYLIEKANMEGIKNYNEGIKREMFVFNHSDKDSINEFIDYRYIGYDANNYVYFNCSDTEDLDTCELWRIIGVFVTENSEGTKEYRLKIISTKPIENINWNDNGSLNWEETSIFDNLNNGDYWYSLKGKFQNMIDSVKFYTGKVDSASTDGNSLYYKERNNYVIAKVGLAYLSDYSYTYSNGVNSGCYSNITNCSDNTNSWMNMDLDYWTMISSSNGAYIISDGIINKGITEEINAYPTVYLKPNVGIESGNGSEGDAYVLHELKKSNYQSEEDVAVGMDESGIKKEVYVDDTASVVPKILLIVSSLIIGIGIAIIIINYIKSKKEIK